MFLLILYTHFSYAFINREELLKIGNKLAWREGILLPPRGRILDADHKKLAWTERYYDFVVKKQFCGKKYIKEINKALKILRKTVLKKIPNRVSSVESLKNDNVIVYGLKSDVDLKIINEKISHFKFFAIKPRLVRLVVDHNSVRQLVGETKCVGDKMIGISGLELKFDERLSGSPIYYKVMLNRKRQWISETFSTKTGKKPQDIVLKKTLVEILNNYKLRKNNNASEYP